MCLLYKVQFIATPSGLKNLNFPSIDIWSGKFGYLRGPMQQITLNVL